VNNAAPGPGIVESSAARAHPNTHSHRPPIGGQNVGPNVAVGVNPVGRITLIVPAAGTLAAIGSIENDSYGPDWRPSLTCDPEQSVAAGPTDVQLNAFGGSRTAQCA